MTNENLLPTARRQPVIVLYQCLLAVGLGLAAWGVAQSNSLITNLVHRWQLDPQLDATLDGVELRAQIWIGVGAAALLLFFLLSGRRQSDEPRCIVQTLLQSAVICLSFYYLVLTRTLQFPITGDDSYIDYTYLRHLFANGQLVFNRDEWIVGFTSHLHLWLLAGLAFITGSRDFDILAQSLNVGSQMALYFLLFFTLARLLKNNWLAIAGCVIFSISLYPIAETAFGKESSQVMLLCVLLVWFADRSSWAGMAWCAVLLFLARPECVMLLAIVGLVSIYRLGLKKGLRVWILPAIPMAAWFIFLQIRYHTILPHGALAKKKIYFQVDSWQAFLNSLRDLFFGQGLPIVFGRIPGERHLMLALIIAATAGAAWAVRSMRIYFVSALAIFLFFGLTHTYMFGWYWGWIAIAPALAIPAIASLAFKWNPQSTALRAARWAPLVILSGCFALCQLHQYRSSHEISSPALPVFQFTNVQQRLLNYREAALMLNKESAVPPTAALPEPGIFGYFYNGKVLDTGGLVSDEAIPYYPVPADQRSNTASFSMSVRLIHEKKPAYVVAFDTFMNNGLLKDPTFAKTTQSADSTTQPAVAEYEQVHFWPNPLWQGTGLYMYKRIAP